MGSNKIHAELLLPSDLCSFETVSEVEEPLDQRLMTAHVGEVVGGGIASGWYRFDLAVSDYEAAAALLFEWAEELGLPEGSCLRRKGAERIRVLVPESRG